MTSLLNSPTARRLVGVLIGFAIVALAVVVGRIVPTQPIMALGLSVAVLALGLTVADAAIIPLLSIPLLLVVYRVGAAGVGLSVSDAVLAVASLTALVFARRPFSPPLRNLLWLSALYQFATLFTVIANPNTASIMEWFHAWMLVTGALLVGWTIGRGGYARLGLSLFVVTTTVLAVITIVEGLQQFAGGDFSAVFVSWPFGMHKNFVGTVLGLGAITAYVQPAWVGWRNGTARTAFWLMSAGVIFTQSRQAIIGLGVALVVVAMRRGDLQRRSRAIMLLVVPALVFVGTLVKDQVESDSAFNSLNQRMTWFGQTLAYWQESPWLGHGLRFWYRAGELSFQPPNAELEMLASAGIVGLIAFLILMGGALLILWRVDPVYGTLAFAVVVSRFVQSQVDLFWVAVQTPVPFVVAGICLGVEALHREDARFTTEAARLPQAIQ